MTARRLTASRTRVTPAASPGRFQPQPRPEHRIDREQGELAKPDQRRLLGQLFQRGVEKSEYRNAVAPVNAVVTLSVSMQHFWVEFAATRQEDAAIVEDITISQPP